MDESVIERGLVLVLQTALSWACLGTGRLLFQEQPLHTAHAYPSLAAF